MEKRAPSGQKGPLMAASPEGDAVPTTGAVGANTGKGFFGSIARKKFSKAVNLVKFAMKFDMSASHDDSKSMFSQKSAVQIQMENSYRMEPEVKGRFSVNRTEEAIQEAFRDHLSKYEYSKVTAPRIIQTLCTVIKEKVKKLGFPRYKIIVNVFMGELDGQGLEATSRCLWDEQKDSFACGTFRGRSYFAVAMVHAVYFE